jgi:hypothetical protein
MSKLPTVMAINNARIINDLPKEPVFKGQHLSHKRYTPYSDRSPYVDAVRQYHENVARYHRAYQNNLEQSRRQGLRTAQEVPRAVHNTFLNKIKNWLKKFRIRNRITPDPLTMLTENSIYRTYGPNGRKSRKKKVLIGGKRKLMKETIIKFKRGPFPKKYTAFVKNKKTKKVRRIHFGDRRYQQYKDRTKLKLYKHKNHGTRKRMQNYFSRHSGTKKRSVAIKKEELRSNGYYNAKILSHKNLW